MQVNREPVRPSQRPGVLLPEADTMDAVLGAGPHLGHPCSGGSKGSRTKLCDAGQRQSLSGQALRDHSSC